MIAPDKRVILKKALETYFVEQVTSLRAAAEKIGVSYPTARRWARDGGWKSKNAEFLKEAEKRAEEARDDSVAVKARTLSIQQTLTISTVRTLEEVLSRRLEAIRRKPEEKGVLRELRDVIELQVRFDDLVLLTLGNLEQRKKPAKSLYDVRIGGDLGDPGRTRVEARHFDSSGHEVDAEGNLIQ